MSIIFFSVWESDNNIAINIKKWLFNTMKICITIYIYSRFFNIYKIILFIKDTCTSFSSETVLFLIL